MNGFETLSYEPHIHRNFLQESNEYAERLRDLTRGTGVLWSSGTTFRNACDISVLYVTGLIPNSPYHTGPILSESNDISTDLAQCTRNGILTISSEPVQTGYEEYTNLYYKIDNASVEFWIRNENIPHLTTSLNEYGDRFRIDIKSREKIKFTDEFGPSYYGENDHTTSMFIHDTQPGTNEMFKILARISSQFEYDPRKMSNQTPQPSTTPQQASFTSPPKKASQPSTTPIFDFSSNQPSTTPIFNFPPKQPQFNFMSRSQGK